MAFSKALTSSIVASYFEVLKKNADRFMLSKKSEARKSLKSVIQRRKQMEQLSEIPIQGNLFLEISY